MTFENSLQFAQELDKKDPLASYRSKFHFPQHEGKDCIYLCGNSLGLQAKTVEEYVQKELNDWKKFGVEGHFEGANPWMHYHHFLADKTARLVGASKEEVVIMNTLSVNLNLLMVSFYKPTKTRFKIMIEADAFGLGGADVEVVESSEAGMLAQVGRSDDRDEPVVFLGWEPHPMNANYDMTYLEGGDDWFGPDLGGATVFTNTTAGYVDACPNVGKLLTNLEFTLAMENEIMGAILNDGTEPDEAATAWMAANTDVVMGWLDGVTTMDGGDAAEAVKAALGM